MIGIVVFTLMLIIILYLLISLISMKSKYNKMMGGKDISDIEGTLIAHIKEVERIDAVNKEIIAENGRIKEFLRLTLSRVSAIRFRAFEDMGSDLSYSVAMLDARNNGVIFSSIFARDDSRSYVKPIEGGRSQYSLTEEEAKVLKDAMNQDLPIKY